MRDRGTAGEDLAVCEAAERGHQVTEVSSGERPRPSDATGSPSCRRCDISRGTFLPASGSKDGGIVGREARRAPERGTLSVTSLRR
jgi:hypothetical protein